MAGIHSRRDFGATLGAALAGTLLHGRSTRASASGGSPSIPVYVGTYTEGTKSRGIYALRFDPELGSLGPAELVAETVNPSFLAIHPSKPWLFAVNEVAELDGQTEGAVSSFVIEGKGLRPINRQPSGGTAPCHLSVDPSGESLLIANYLSGSLGVKAIEPGSGVLKTFGVVFQAEGSSVNPQRQQGPHAHCVRFEPSGRFAVEADLGIDRVHVFRFRDPATPKAPLRLVHTIVARPGSGPRHLAFHPTGRFLFINGELDSTLNAYRFDPQTGKAEEIEHLSTLPAGGHPGNSTAETVVHPSGKFVYVSNRGHDSIARFRFDAENAKLTALGHTPTGGKTPRNFNVDPSGNWLLAANQDSGTVTVFRFNSESGDLTPVGKPAEVPAPVCLVFGRN